MSPRELAICQGKRWIARHSLVQQIDTLQQIRSTRPRKARRQQKIFRARIKIESGEIGGWLGLNGQFLGH